MLILFHSLALSVSAVHSTESPPELEQQFGTNASAQMYINGQLISNEGSYFVWYMDQPNDRYRTEMTQNRRKTGALPHYGHVRDWED
jgi:hypothetical protein